MTERPWIIVGILAVSVPIGVLLLRGAPDRRNGRGPRPAQEGLSAEEDIRVEPPKPQGPRGSIRVVRRQKTTDDAGATDDSGDVYRIPRWPGEAGFLTGGINSRGARVGIDAEGQPDQPSDWSTQAGLGRGRDPKPVQRAPDPVDPSRQLENDRKDAPSEDPDLILSLPLDGRVAVKGDVQVIIEENLKIDETTGTVEFPSDSMLGIANAHIRAEAGTISMEVVPRWDGSDGGAASFIQVKTPEMWQGAISLVRSGSYMLFQFWDADGVDHVVATDIGNWQSGEPHTVTATWGGALMSMYIDGELRDQTPYSGDPAFSPDWPLFVGSSPQNGLPGANATLKDLRIYSRALTGEEIAAAGSGS